MPISFFSLTIFMYYSITIDMGMGDDTTCMVERARVCFSFILKRARVHAAGVRDTSGARQTERESLHAFAFARPCR